MIVNYDLKRMWDELVVASFKVLSQLLSGGSEENYGQDFKPGPPNYKAEVLTTQPHICSMRYFVRNTSSKIKILIKFHIN
jgi:hypothetical protein